MPGGVNSPVRAMRQIGRDHAIFIERGEGCELVDVDGNRYVDWVCSWGPLILGHAHPGVVAAVRDAAEAGTSFGAPTEAEVELAAEVRERFRSVEMVRMVNSGTEATMSALRLARAATGRDKVVKFAGAYHGHVDGLLAEAGSGLATWACPRAPGVTAAPGGRDGRRALERWRSGGSGARRARRGGDAGRAGRRPTWAWSRPRTGFLEFLREATDEHGALLVFDEVITGFRVARGGAQELYGVDARPDGAGQGARRRAAGGRLRRPRAS